VLKRDRVVMTLNGTAYLSDTVMGHVTGVVFTGTGTVHADVPATPSFEKENVQRLLGADVIDSDFKTAVFRMTDDTVDVFTKCAGARTIGAAAPQAPPDIQKIAADFEPRLLHDTSLNLSARLALSLLNAENPGVFFAEFDGGKRGRFDYVFDPQTRVPTLVFGVDGGEKGLIFAPVLFQAGLIDPEIWTAFYAEQDYGKVVPYSDSNNLVDIIHYGLDIDLRNPGTTMGVVATIEMASVADHVQAIPFNLGRGLSTYLDERLKNQLRLKSASIGGKPIAFTQEDWEGGFTLFLPAPIAKGDKVTIEVSYAGNFLNAVPDAFFLKINDDWLPTHGPLDRATYDMTYRYSKRFTVASAGTRTSDATDPARSDVAVSTFKMEQPVALVAFALGVFNRTRQKASADKGGDAVPLEFYSISKHVATVSDDYFLAEMDNAVRFFSQYFGKYPFPQLSAVTHPYPFGQGFASILFLYAFADGSRTDNGVSAEQFISHETSHQWWGHAVLWRSYRDQWLSEGFAEYSSFVYAGQRDDRSQNGRSLTQQGPGHHLLIERGRDELRNPPRTITGVGKGRLADIGPIILGHRLNTSKSGGAYQALIYQKGALVLRMLNYLLSNPSQPTKSDQFFTLMASFVDKYRGGSATTEQFFDVANAAFVQSPIAQKYNLTDLNWFLDQWVYQAGVPTYTLEYDLQPQADNSCIIAGTLHQDGVPDTWKMPLPIAFTFADGKVARTSVFASGPTSKVQIKLPSRPAKVELDPASWILSDKTITKGK